MKYTRLCLWLALCGILGLSATVYSLRTENAFLRNRMQITEAHLSSEYEAMKTRAERAEAQNVDLIRDWHEFEGGGGMLNRDTDDCIRERQAAIQRMQSGLRHMQELKKWEDSERVRALKEWEDSQRVPPKP